MIDASPALERLNGLVREVVNLRRAAVLIGWDERVSMPPGGVAMHGEMAATIQRVAHEQFRSAELGSAMEDAAREIASLPPDSEPARLVKQTARDYRRAVRVPSEFVAEQTRVSSAAHQAWKEARAQSNYGRFQPHLEKVVRLQQQFAAFFQPLEHPYDALIDTYEPGMLTSEVQSIFDRLRPRQVELVRGIQGRPVDVAPFLSADYDERKMLAFSTEVITAFGLWENIIGRSRPFWQHFFPHLQRHFPSQLGAVTLDQFYRGINQVKRSLIRVEADEVTYNLHVMLRVEIEIALLTGVISTKDLPEYWNAKMEEYLGIVPDSDANGILQDMHWSIGVFGYFPTYTLGNLISVQLWDQYTQDDPQWASRIHAGEFGTLREWLRDALYQHGRSYAPRDLVMRITGQPISTAPYLSYLESKYK